MRCDCGYLFSLGNDTAVRRSQGRQESKGGWYPTKQQWIVIWVSAGLASAFVLSEFLPGALVCVVIGGLLVWQLSGVCDIKVRRFPQVPANREDPGVHDTPIRAATVRER
jgi:hypothetical protein